MRIRTQSSKGRSLENANHPIDHDFLPEVLKSLSRIPPSRKTEYLNEVVMSKFVSMDTAPSSVRRQRAVNKWLASERNNDATNVRLLTVDEGYNILPRVTYRSFMNTLRSIIVDVLGETVPAKALSGAFSGGASTSRKRKNAHPARKYADRADVTESALDHAIGEIVSSPIWTHCLNELRLVTSNIMFTVPKNTDEDRCCCKEPDLNMYLQKGVGDYIRRRLRHHGIDLNDQSRNQSLARKGSESGDLATLDLSRASDSISTELVFQALPALWFSVLDDLRCRSTVLPDYTVHKNQMFSSMGNGFTFELESLLFYAIAKATVYHLGIRGVVSVFGDDLIVPTESAGYLISVLLFLGFETNVEKSFFTGSFRESCGGHFDSGRDVTPFYIRKPVTHLIDVIHLANSIRKWARQGGPWLDDDVAELWVTLASVVPDKFWGGHDYDDKCRLVSLWQPDQPHRLKEVIESKRRTGVGGYALWLDTTKDRTVVGDVIETSTESRYAGVYRAKRLPFPTPVTDAWFHCETFSRQLPSPDPQ